MSTRTPPMPTDHATMLGDLGERLHLWLVPLEHSLDAAWVAENRRILAADELARCDRYLRPADADLFLAAHVTVRRILSRYADVEPAGWDFIANAHGRPEAVHADAPSGLRFNLSHTIGMTAVLVHDRCASGVDAELVGRVADPVAMSRTVFADRERDELLALPASAQSVAFTRLWTLKEAFIKAKGKGLAIPLKEFWFTGFAEDDGPLQLGCGPEIDPDPTSWDVAVRAATDHHVVATATRRGPAGPRPVHVLDASLASL
jgi:4'-phosphopantetheinyl transferase